MAEMEQFSPVRKEQNIMKTYLTNLLGLAALGMTLLTTPVPTWAGLVTPQEVSINGNQVARWACGSMTDARYSADTHQLIGCRTYTGALSLTYCYAVDSAQRALSCVSADNKFLEVVEGMTDSSAICFVIDNTSNSGSCTDIGIANS